MSTSSPPTNESEEHAYRLHGIEPFARFVLRQGIPRSARCCEKHSLDHAILTKSIGTVLQHRTLMPMCIQCVMLRQQDLELDATFRSSIDSCNCAAFVFDSAECQWCAVEELCARRDSYQKILEETLYDYDNNNPVSYLRCACGRVPMGTPSDAAHVREVMRMCSGCSGVVNVPLHHLNGESHLACMPGKRSEAILDGNGLIWRSVVGELVGLGANDEACTAHPVRTVAQKVIWERIKRGGTRAGTTVSGLSGLGSPMSSGTDMHSQASLGVYGRSLPYGDMVGQVPASGRMDIQSQVSGQAFGGMIGRYAAPPVFGGMEDESAAERRSQGLGGRNVRPPAFGGLRMPAFGEMGKRPLTGGSANENQQRSAPVANMMGRSTPADDRYIPGQLNQGFKFPR